MRHLCVARCLRGGRPSERRREHEWMAPDHIRSRKTTESASQGCCVFMSSLRRVRLLKSSPLRAAEQEGITHVQCAHSSA